MFFKVFSTVIFFIAIFHVFFSNHFLKLAHRLKNKRDKHNFAFSSYSFLGNAALIFGIWLIPILLVMVVQEGQTNTFDFLKSIDLIEPFAYFVLITVATIRPIHNLFDALMQKMSAACKNQILFFWVGIILFSSILTGIFSEIAIMALVGFQLSSSFFSLKPSTKLTYFTFALLLLGISVGPTIIPFNFSFFLKIVDGNLSHWQIFTLFGWKVLFALLCICIGVGYLFRKEFTQLQKGFAKEPKKIKISFREIFYALLFFVASVGKGNPYVLLMVLALVVILHKSFYRIKGEEGRLQLYFPLIIAFFTFTLEMHAGLQKWWVLPLFERVEGIASYGYAFLLTGLNEHVPLEALKETLQNASASTQFFSYLGVLAGGGLTIIAKSANIVAKLTLKEHFPHHAISPFLHLFIAIPLGLLLSAIITILHFLGGS